MIITEQKENLILSDGDDVLETMSTELDLESADFLMTMMTKGFYSDAIGSTIRETASNALDSHREAGTDVPIIVRLGMSETGDYEYSVEDFGVGLDDDDVRNIIRKYGKSTRRNKENVLGAFGLGFKSPLSYTSAFYFIARKNGIERKYMMYEGEERGGIDMLYQLPTYQPDGVKIIVPVKRGDRYAFITCIKTQLAYFENVYFDVDGIENDFSIMRNDIFQTSPLCNDNLLHICLDNIYYPIDFNKLGIDSISFPGGLRFSTSDGIIPLPNRENIRYTVETKQIINNKIKELADYLMVLLEEKIANYSVHYVIKSHIRPENTVNVNGQNIDVDWAVSISGFSKSAKVDGVSLLDYKKCYYYLLEEYRAVNFIDRGRIKECRYRTYRDASVYYNYLNDKLKWVDNFPTLYLLDNGKRIKPSVASYLREKHRHNTATVISKKSSGRALFRTVDGKSSYYTTLGLNGYDRSVWRQLIQEMQLIEKLLLEDAIPISSIVIEKEDVQHITCNSSHTTLTRKQKPAGSISVKEGEPLEKYTGNNCKFVSKDYDLSTLHRNKKVYIYSVEDDKLKLDGLYLMFLKTNLKFWIVSNREFEKLSKLNIHNLINLKRFMEGDTIMFKRIATAYLIRDLYKNNRSAFDNYRSLEPFSAPLSSKINSLRQYLQTHHNPSGNIVVSDAILEVANKYSLYDYSIYDTYVEVKDILEKHYFIDSILKEYSNYGDVLKEDGEKMLKDLLKYYKFRMNAENYRNNEQELQTI